MVRDKMKVIMEKKHVKLPENKDSVLPSETSRWNPVVTVRSDAGTWDSCQTIVLIHLQALLRHERSLSLSHTKAHTPVSWQSLRSYPNACGCSPGSLWGQTWRRLWCACAGVGYSLTWSRRNDMIQLEANNSPPTVQGFVVLGSIWRKYGMFRNDCTYLLLQKPLMASHTGLNNKVFQQWQSNFLCDKIFYEKIN